MHERGVEGRVCVCGRAQAPREDARAQRCAPAALRAGDKQRARRRARARALTMPPAPSERTQVGVAGISSRRRLLSVTHAAT